MNQCWATAVGQDLNEWYVCVCVWERETERERERDCVLGVLLLKKKGRMIPASAYRRDWGETDISSLETIYKYKTKYMVQCISMLEMLEWLWWSEIALGALSKRGFLGRVLKKFGGPRLGPWRDCLWWDVWSSFVWFTLCSAESSWGKASLSERQRRSRVYWRNC